MIHAKAVVIDDEFALAGSANLDGRSLFLDYEMMIAFYDRKAVRGFAAWVNRGARSATPTSRTRRGWRANSLKACCCGWLFSSDAAAQEPSTISL